MRDTQELRYALASIKRIIPESITDIFQDAVEELIEIRRANEWIPVIERLPEENGTYLCFIVNEPYKYYMTCEFSRTTFFGNIKEEWYTHDDCASANVIAWKPIEPYRSKKKQEPKTLGIYSWMNVAVALVLIGVIVLNATL